MRRGRRSRAPGRRGRFLLRSDVRVTLTYACQRQSIRLVAKRGTLKRTSFFVDVTALRRARKALGVATDAEAVRIAVERVGEMERFWRFMRRTRGALKPGSMRAP